MHTFTYRIEVQWQIWKAIWVPVLREAWDYREAQSQYSAVKKKKDCRITYPNHICSTQHQQCPILHNRFQENIHIIRLRFHSSLSQSSCRPSRSHPLPHIGFSTHLTSACWQHISRKTAPLQKKNVFCQLRAFVSHFKCWWEQERHAVITAAVR